MKKKKKKPPLNLNPKDEIPLSLRVILPNADGDAIGLNADTDTAGVGIAMPGKTASVARYGVAYAPGGGTAHAGAQGAAVVHAGGLADAGDGATAYIWNGKATATQWSTAYALWGDTEITRNGVATVLLKGSATVDGEGGVACALNFAITLLPSGLPVMVTDPTAGTVSGGVGSVVVAFTVDGNGQRVPVVGFIGAQQGAVQFGLNPNVPYRLNPQTGQFEVVHKRKTKKAKTPSKRGSARGA